MLLSLEPCALRSVQDTTCRKRHAKLQELNHLATFQNKMSILSFLEKKAGVAHLAFPLQQPKGKCSVTAICVDPCVFQPWVKGLSKGRQS